MLWEPWDQQVPPDLSSEEADCLLVSDELKTFTQAVVEAAVTQNMHPRTILVGVHMILMALRDAGLVSNQFVREELELMGESFKNDFN